MPEWLIGPAFAAGIVVGAVLVLVATIKIGRAHV